MQSICFISPYAYPLLIPNEKGAGGAERQFLLFGKELESLGWDVSFITEHPIESHTRQKTILPVYPCSFSYLGGSNFRMPLDWLSLFFAMKKTNSKYFVIKVPGHLLTPLSIFCRLFNKKLIFWGQMTFDAIPSLRKVNALAGWLQDWGLKQTDMVIAQTKEQQRGFLDNYGIRSFVVNSICTTLTDTHSPPPIETRSTHKNIDVLWVGNSAEKKRYEIVVHLAELMPETKFAIAMNISDKARFSQARQDCKNTTNLNFLGMLPPSEMEYFFSETKIFLNTSTQEGFPNTFLQSWMNGKPVVSLNIDPDNIIQDNSLGVIVDKKLSKTHVNDHRYLALQLKHHISELLDDNERISSIRKNSKQYIAKHHIPTKVIPKLIEALNNCSGKNRQ